MKRGQAAYRSRGPRRTSSRTGKIMEGQYFEGMAWTRTFVSGPMDPEWNSNKMYCQICMCNFSSGQNDPTAF